MLSWLTFSTLSPDFMNLSNLNGFARFEMISLFAIRLE